MSNKPLPKFTETESDENNANTHDEVGIGKHDDRLIDILHQCIRVAVKVLAILMAFVIFLGVIDVVYVLYTRLVLPPVFILKLSDMLVVFGTFLSVLIAIEIFLNITLYLRDDIIHVKLVVATALMAIARKIIIIDFKFVDYTYVTASGILIFSLGIIYWLISKKE